MCEIPTSRRSEHPQGAVFGKVLISSCSLFSVFLGMIQVKNPVSIAHYQARPVRADPGKKSGMFRELDPGKMSYAKTGDVPIAPKTRTNGLKMYYIKPFPILSFLGHF